VQGEIDNTIDQFILFYSRC